MLETHNLLQNVGKGLGCRVPRTSPGYFDTRDEVQWNRIIIRLEM